LHRFSALKQAGVVACLVICGACAQVALVSVTPVIAVLSLELDQDSGRELIELEKKKDWPGMLRLARTLVQREPGRANWWFLQGYALARQGQHAEAIQSFEKVVRITPEDERTWLSMGKSQSELGQSERAIQTYKQALRYRPESAEAYLALADVYRKQGKLDLAIPNYRECVRYDADSIQGWYGLTLSYHLDRQRERRDEALQSLRKLAPVLADEFEKQYPAK
jgi:tetratricopeptide (TPR) repeat protein